MGSVLYDCGLPFSPVLATALDDIHHRVFIKNKAAMIVVDGSVGEGKTTLAVHITEYLQKKEIDFKKQYGMGGEQFVSKLRECYAEKLPVIIYDEAGDFNRRGALTRFNMMLNRVFETYRAFKIIVIAVLPRFYVLDSGILEMGVARMLVHCYDRGQNDGTFKTYDLPGMYRLMKWSKILTIKPQCYNYASPNHRGHFLDLPPDRREKLNKITVSGKSDMLDLATIRFNDLVSLKDLIRETQRSRSWVQYSLNKIHVKPEQTIKKVAYYPRSVIIRLLGLVDSAQERREAEARGNGRDHKKTSTMEA